MKVAVIIFIFASLAVGSVAQTVPDSVYENAAVAHLMALLNLRPTDLTFRDDYSKIDSFRLETVSHLMKDPYGMISFAENTAGILKPDELSATMDFVLKNLKESGKETSVAAAKEGAFEDTGTNLYYQSLEFNRFLTTVKKCIKGRIEPAQKAAFSKLSTEQKSFLTTRFNNMILEDTSDASKAVDVLDSLQKLEEKYLKDFTEFGHLIDQGQLVRAGAESSVDIYDELVRFLRDVREQGISYSDILKDTVDLPQRTGLPEFLGREKGWKIGGTGDDVYQGDYQFIFDFGGNDHYELEYDAAHPHPCIIIDLSGDDDYQAKSDFNFGSGCMSVGILIDLEGDDIYNANNFSCGSGFFGFGLLYDGAGGDRYLGDTHCQGAGVFGAGVLIDKSGTDLYNAALFSQGVGLTEGLGLIADYAGNDNYVITDKYPETYGLAGNNQHFLSLSQGFGYGMRPYMSGGIGIIADFGGNDNYKADIFGQGGSYWWGLGMIYDDNGNDNYVAHQYAQGAGIHLSLGILFDREGDDFRKGKGLMQGCGHDYGCGIIVDRYGNDTYDAFDLSQGAGQANGFGILIDDRGEDAYYVMRKNNTQGYGNPRRDFGSIGLFLDLGGFDHYDGNGGDHMYWNTGSKWGGGMDWDFIKEDTTDATP